MGKKREKQQPWTPLQPEVVVMVLLLAVEVTTVIRKLLPYKEVREIRKRRVDDEAQVHPAPVHDHGKGPDGVVIEVETLVAPVQMKVTDDQNVGHVRGRLHRRPQKGRKNDAIKIKKSIKLMALFFICMNEEEKN